MVITFNYKISVIFIICLLLIVCILKLKLKRNNYQILFFAVAYIYMMFIIYETQFPIFIQNTLMEKELGGLKFGRDINIIPLKDIINMTSILNIILFIPVGFVMGFVIKNNIKWTLIIGSIISALIEICQLMINIFIGYNFRVTDINDIICNTAGAAIGYIIMVLFVKIVRKVFAESDEKIICYIKNRID